VDVAGIAPPAAHGAVTANPLAAPLVDPPAAAPAALAVVALVALVDAVVARVVARVVVVLDVASAGRIDWFWSARGGRRSRPSLAHPARASDPASAANAAARARRVVGMAKRR
jgi:hypothetical protein